MKNKKFIFVGAAIVIIVILAGVLIWHPWGIIGGSQPTQEAAAPTIPQVPQTPAGYSAKLTSTTLTIVTPQQPAPVVITAKKVTTVHHDALVAASSTPVSLGENLGTSTLAGVPGYLQALAQQMGFVPLSTSYTLLFGKEKVYFAAKGMPNTSNQGKLSVFSYDSASGLTQIAVLPDAGLESVSDIALSPGEQYLVFFQCDKPTTGAGCYQLSYGFVVFDLFAKTAVGSVGAQPTVSPQHLYSFGQWFNDTSFSYHIYQPTTGTGSGVISLGENAYASSGDQTFDIP